MAELANELFLNLCDRESMVRVGWVVGERLRESQLYDRSILLFVLSSYDDKRSFTSKRNEYLDGCFTRKYPFDFGGRKDD